MRTVFLNRDKEKFKFEEVTENKTEHTERMQVIFPDKLEEMPKIFIEKFEHSSIMKDVQEESMNKATDQSAVNADFSESQAYLTYWNRTADPILEVDDLQTEMYMN